MNDYYNKNDLDVVKKIFQDSINGKITDSGMINNSERVDRIIRFNEKYKKYFVNQLKDEDITDEVTQMCWQSMFLKRKRLQENGILVSYEDAGKRQGAIKLEEAADDGNKEVYIYKQPAKIRKTFWKNGSALKTKNENRAVITNIIDTNLIGENIKCPRCGHIAPVYTYADGCDYCRAKFSINDLGEKISSYNICKDEQSEVKKSIKKMFIAFGTVFAVLAVTMMLALIYGILVSVDNSGNEKLSMGTGLVFLTLYKVLPKLWGLIAVAFIVLMAVYLKLFHKAYRRIRKSSALTMLKMQSNSFSEEKFASSIEYRLLNIHFAEKAYEVNAFASFDMSEIIEKYRDVIDCSMENLQVLKTKVNGNKKCATVKTILKLTKCNGNKIREEYEQVELEVYSEIPTFYEDTGSIRMYNCKRCGSTISLMEGGVCKNCNSTLDFLKYSYIITGYRSNCGKDQLIEEKIAFGKKKPPNLTVKFRLGMAAITIFVVIIVGILGHSVAGDDINILTNYDKYSREITTYNDGIKRLEEVCSGICQEKSEVEAFEKVFYYNRTEGVIDAVEMYEKYLKDQGYTVGTDENYSKEYIKMTDIGKELKDDIYSVVLIENVDGMIKVSFQMMMGEEIYDERD